MTIVKFILACHSEAKPKNLLSEFKNKFNLYCMEIKQEKKQSEMIKIVIEDDDGKFIGRVSLFLIFNDLHKQPYGLLEDVFVEEEFRSDGYGTKLLKEAIEVAKEKGCYKLIGQSRHFKQKVHDFYLKLGFKDWGKNFRMDF